METSVNVLKLVTIENSNSHESMVTYMAWNRMVTHGNP